METFTAWLYKQLKDKNISMRELARMSNVSHASISLVLSGKQAITPDFCKAIAKALDEPPNRLLEMAGIIELPKPPGTSPTAKEMLSLFDSLSDSDQEELLQLARIKLERQQGRGKRGAKP